MIDEFSVNNFCSCKFFSTWKHFQISPLCLECKSKLWPAVVFFGEAEKILPQVIQSLKDD
jgi:NAD-dependent SIR2 family protein deacetylase